MGGAARGSGQGRADHADDDGGHGGRLTPARVLAEHPLPDKQEHQQPGGQRGLDDDERREQQCRDLQRPSQNGESGPEQPAGADHQLTDQAQAQIVVLTNLPRVHGLQGDP